jgi:predicted nucleic acid-binding protein
MVLVDTSVWIAVFRRERPLDLLAHVAFDEIVTCLPVVQEVLQGFRDEGAYRKARKAMLNLPIVDSPMEPAVFESAVELYRAARRAGITVRSSVDCLIAASALRHGLEVLHRDRDYKALAKISGLRQRPV